MTERPARGDAAHAWWQAHISDEAPDRGVRARLRRCADAREALSLPQALGLWRRLGLRDDRMDQALNLAIVLAHVREHDVRHPMQAAGWKKFPGQMKESDADPEIRPLLSGLRFRRLLQSETDAELADAFRRLVKMLGEQANVGILATSFLNWGHPEWGDEVRRNWGFQYYRARMGQAEEIQ